jgi:hypothetical protein
MSFASGPHRAWRRDLVDDALGLLAPDREAALRCHVDGCPRCRDERDRLERTLAVAAVDPAGEVEPPLPLAALVARVEGEIQRRQADAMRGPGWWWWPRALAAAAVLWVAVVARRPAPLPEVHVSAETLRRMERIVDREQTARYLQEAQGVLLSVTAALPHCDRAGGRRVVAAEAEKSRQLLVRRRLLVDAEAEHLAAARPVLDDVENALAAVAALDACAAPAELQSIARRLSEQHLVMKMDLMARELQG